jgi:hypothetical protein
MPVRDRLGAPPCLRPSIRALVERFGYSNPKAWRLSSRARGAPGTPTLSPPCGSMAAVALAGTPSALQMTTACPWSPYGLPGILTRACRRTVRSGRWCSVSPSSELPLVLLPSALLAATIAALALNPVIRLDLFPARAGVVDVIDLRLVRLKRVRVVSLHPRHCLILPVVTHEDARPVCAVSRRRYDGAH